MTALPSSPCFPRLASFHPQEAAIDRDKAQAAVKGRTCASCPRTQTSRWYKNPQDPTSKICHACYNRINEAKIMATETAKGTTCANCLTKKTSRWYRNPQDSTSKICQGCYYRINQANIMATETAKGTTCANCSTAKTSRWYKNPQDSTTKMCNGCFLRIFRANKAVKKTPNEPALLREPFSAVRPKVSRKKRKNDSEEMTVPPLPQKQAKLLMPVPNLQINQWPFIDEQGLNEEPFLLFSASSRSLDDCELDFSRFLISLERETFM